MVQSPETLPLADTLPWQRNKTIKYQSLQMITSATGKMSSLYLSELNKLKISQKQLEKYQSTTVDQLIKAQNIEFQQLIQHYQSSKLACDETSSEVQVRNILDSVKHMKKVVILEGGSNISDLELFQENLIEILNRLQDLKVQSQNKVEELTSIQNQLNDDMELYSERLQLWSEPAKIDLHKNGVYSKVNVTNTDLPKDVKIFMDFVKTSNGHENGWAPNDHHLFLKLRKKYNDLNELSKNLHEILPDKSISEVEKHETWYKKYIKLKEKNCEAIKSWQKQKKDIPTSNSDFVGNCNDSEVIPKNPLELKQIMHKDKKLLKEEIDNWKKARDKIKSIEKALKETETRERKKKDKARNDTNKIKKELIEKWKHQKTVSEQARKKSEEARNLIEQRAKTSVANKMIKIYQERDKALSNKNVMQRETKLPQKISKGSSQIRDSERLFRPTKQWVHRFLATGEEDSSRTVNFIGGIQKLQTPLWRRES